MGLQVCYRYLMRRGAFVCLLACVAAAMLPPSVTARVLTDHIGRRVEVPDQPRRIVSLAPNLTETLFALGLGDRVVGVSDFCDFPPEARSKPKVGGVINPSVEAVVSLKPDLVLISREGNRRETMMALERLRISVFAVSAERLGDVFRLIRDVAATAGVAARGEALADRLEQQAAEIEAAVRPYQPRRVVLLVWLHPIISVGRGSFLDDLLRRTGAVSISAGSAQPWPHLSVEQVVRSNPEFLLVPRSPGFAPTREQLLGLPGWRELPAVQQGRIIYLPWEVERPGPRLVEMQRRLAGALHPEAFAPKP